MSEPHFDLFIDWCEQNIETLHTISKDKNQFFVVKRDEGLVFYTSDKDKYAFYLLWLREWCNMYDIFCSQTNNWV